MRACGQSDKNAANAVRERLSTWVAKYNAVQIPPSKNELEDARVALHEQRERLGDSIFRDIVVLLDDWSRSNRLRKW